MKSFTFFWHLEETPHIIPFPRFMLFDWYKYRAKFKYWKSCITVPVWTFPLFAESCNRHQKEVIVFVYKRKQLLMKDFLTDGCPSTWWPMNVRPCPAAAHGALTIDSTKLLPDCRSDPWDANCELFPREQDEPTTKWSNSNYIDDTMRREDDMSQVDKVLPDRVLRRHVCAIGTIERLQVCVTLIVIKEMPTVVHRGSLTTNHLHLSFYHHTPHTLLCPKC